MIRRGALALLLIAGGIVAFASPAAAETDPPTIVGSIIPAPTPSGWNNGPVTVHFDCNDAGSGIASCTPDQAVAGGPITVIAGQAVDNDGNTAEDAVTVKIDTVGPILQVTTTPPATTTFANGPVTVHATCGDALSGIAVCPPDQAVVVDGNTPVNMIATDKAGNNTNAAVIVKIDTAGPTIVPNIAGTPGDNGFYKSNVTVTYTCNDAGAGVRKCQSPKTVSTDGIITLKAAAVDNVGHATTIDVPLKIDKTKPKGNINTPRRTGITPGATISGSASDGMSGVKTVTVTYDTGPAAAVALVCFSSSRVCTWTVAGPAAVGNRTAFVTVTDYAGNVSVSALTRFKVI